MELGSGSGMGGMVVVYISMIEVGQMVGLEKIQGCFVWNEMMILTFRTNPFIPASRGLGTYDEKGWEYLRVVDIYY